MFSDAIEVVVYCLVILALTPVVGGYMYRVYSGHRTWLTPVLRPCEAAIYKALRMDPATPQRWSQYALVAITLNFAGWLILYLILRFQHVLPLNPAGHGPISADLAFNVAVSFVTNTNWQSYSGEAALSHFSQMTGLSVQNFISAATGMAVAIAVIRGFAADNSKTLGNFYVDLVRSILYVLLPLSLAAALVLLWQGVPQNFSGPVIAETIEGPQQLIAQGPVASQLAIKQLGTNGGGFFNANSAHPYENPTPLSNFLQLTAILLIGAGFTYTFGKMVRDHRQGWAIFAAMSAIFLAALAVVYVNEIHGNPLFASAPIDPGAGNMEGKEVRFGIINSTLWAVATTAASNGSVNSMHDSFMPLSGLALIFLMDIGEVAFGGVGAGLYSMLLFVVLTVFIAGLMVGRTPEYLGKKIQTKEVKLAMLALLSVSIGVLGGAALTAAIPSAAASVQDRGPHGLSEILYAYSSATNNNGSAFAGFSANTVFHNTALGLCMLLGRYAFIVAMLAIAGSLAEKQKAPFNSGTFPTHTAVFVMLLIFVIAVVQGLTFFPSFVLGPVAEHFAIATGKTF